MTTQNRQRQTPTKKCYPSKGECKKVLSDSLFNCTWNPLPSTLVQKFFAIKATFQHHVTQEIHVVITIYTETQ